MKKRIICIIAALMTIMMVFTSCENVDPTVKQKDEPAESGETTDIVTSDADSGEDATYTAYGDGAERTETVNGVEVNIDSYVLRGYELAFFFAVKEFSKPSELPVDVLVQFAFCHLYYDNLYEMPHEGVVYRDAKLSEITEIVEQYFGKTGVDLKTSILYNQGKKKFEMWQPGYGTNVYYTIDAAEVDGSKVQIAATFYNEMAKETLKGYLDMTLTVKNGKITISKFAINLGD